MHYAESHSALFVQCRAPAHARLMTEARHRLLREPARPERIRSHPHAHWLVVASVSVGAFMGQLDASIVTLATPAIQRGFGVSLAAASWVALSYLLTLVAAVIPIGRLADALGRKLVYVYGFGLFTLASAACAFAPSIGVLDASRVLQGVGAAMLQANSVALIRIAMPSGTVGRGIGVQAVSQALGLALGPSVGGILVHAWGWRSVFLVNVPAGVIGIIAGVLLLPRTRATHKAPEWDVAGVALLAALTTGALLALTAIERGSLTSAAVALPGTIALLATIVLALHTAARQRTGRDALLPLDLLANRHFRAALGAGLLSYLMLFGTLFITPFVLEEGLRWTPSAAGLFLTLLPAAIAVVTPFAGRMADRHGPTVPTTAGMLLATGAFAIAATGSSAARVGLALVLLGLGSGMFTPANNAAIMLLASHERASVAGGVLNMTRAFGTALGVALVSVIYSRVGGGDAGFRASVLTLMVLAGAAAALALRADGHRATERVAA